MHFDETFDVVICGFGHGGAISAITAADQGAKTLILEKSTVPGGLSICSYGAVRSARDVEGAFAYGAGEWVLFKTLGIAALGAALRPFTGTLITLQRNPQAGEIAALEAASGARVHDFSALNDDLEAMLAVLDVIDEYVGVSNTNVHLRACTGRITRVLVPAPPEWRWMAAGRFSPWFPQFPIYRQSNDGAWDAALAELARDLVTAYAAKP